MRYSYSLLTLLALAWGVAAPARAQDAPEMVLSGLLGGLATIAFSPDGETVAAAGDFYKGNNIFGGVIGMWNTATGAPKPYIEIHPFQAFSLAFSPDGKTLAVGTHPEIRFFDVATGKQQSALHMDGGVSRLAYSRDGKVIAGGLGLGATDLRVFDVATGKPLFTWQQRGAWARASRCRRAP